MSILDSDQEAGLHAAIQNIGGESEVEHEEQYAEEAETQYEEEPDGEFEETEFEEAEYEDEDEESDEEGHSVPYGRFSNVISARNSAREEADELREQLGQMQNQFQQMQQFQQMMGRQQDTEQHEEAAEPRTELSIMQDQMRNMSVQQEQVTLEREMASVRDEFPNVDDSILLNAVIQNPEVDIRDVAEAYSSHIAEIEEDAINRFISGLDLGEADEEDNLPPEMASTRGRQRTTTSASGNKPQTMEAAHNALAGWLQDN